MAKDIPLAEIILRRYEKPYQTEKRELMKKICLSVGLLQPGDSRDVIVDVLLVLDSARKSKEQLTSDEIKKRVEETRARYNLEMRGIAESNIRRQLKRLSDSMLLDKKGNLYNLNEFSSMSEIFENKIERFVIPQCLERVKEYLAELEKT
ncbi:MAG: hypothetical protein KKB21_03010 [Nanoarchaeota archaeon]|nr:hypothetical protein [Nanoarchaeota archaeon]MBU4086522.1 hypothetical protein [Nanoarchaeota archaeon]